MAITRAQQVRQMLKAGGGMLVSPSEDGKRPGYRFGDERDTRGFREKVDKQVKDEQAAANKEKRRTQPDRPKSTFRSEIEDEIVTRGNTEDRDYVRNQIMQTGAGKDDDRDFSFQNLPFIPSRKKAFNLATNLIPGSKKSTIRKRKAYADYLKSMGVIPTEELEDTENLFRFFDKQAFETPTPLDANVQPPMSYGDFILERFGSPGVKFSGNIGDKEVYVKGYRPDGSKIYDVRERTSGRDDPMPLIYNQGQVGIGSGDNEETEDSTNDDPFEANFRLLADGGMPDDAPVGGIMDLESARQMYGLGKLVKKATRAVKKIAKSPIGKAALVAGGLGLAGVGPFAGLKTSSLGKFLLGAKGPPGLAKTGFLQKMFLKNPSLGFSLGNLSGTAMIGIPTALSYFMTPKQDQDEEESYLGPTLDVAGIEERPYDFINYRQAADGGLMRQQYQEGSKEPVAKKTMPLLDMGGMEKDYRANGGFVPIGRMEKADDVPARLSKNEFVFTADAVRNAGEGDIDKGAEVMYNMMKNLEAGGEVSEESQGLEGARRMFQTSQRLGEVI